MTSTSSRPRVLELTYTSHAMKPWAEDLGYSGTPFAWNEDRRARLRAELDVFFARKYGLTEEELQYVLDPAKAKGSDYPSETFRVLKEKEIRQFDEYRTERLVLEAWKRMERISRPTRYLRRRVAASRRPVGWCMGMAGKHSASRPSPLRSPVRTFADGSGERWHTCALHNRQSCGAGTAHASADDQRPESVDQARRPGGATDARRDPAKPGHQCGMAIDVRNAAHLWPIG